MRALIQRVSQASVRVEGEIVGQIGEGLLVFLGVQKGDTDSRARLLARKVTHLRVFNDDKQKMNLSVTDIGGEILVVSQFTLYADTSSGNRPSYSQAAKPEVARPLYEHFVSFCRAEGLSVATGTFQAQMEVVLTNQGPVTLLCSAET